mgnify:CR=1 FL=1
MKKESDTSTINSDSTLDTMIEYAMLFDFYEMTIDDFTMQDYQPIKPQLKLELGI